MFGGWHIPISHKVPGPMLSEPIKVTFPQCSTDSPHDPTFSKGVHQLFKQIRKLPDITPEHLECLNVSLKYDVPLDQIVPTYPPAKSDPGSPPVNYLPDENGEDAKSITFAERKRELLVPNEHAFKSLQRLRRDIKLGHFYKFYQSLDLVGNYYTVNDGAHAGMPERFREEMVKNFVEPICWGYNARLLDARNQFGQNPPPRAPPRVQFQTSRFATRLDFYAYASPALPAEKKSGVVEGPLFGVQCRHEDYFVYPGGPQCQEDSPPPEPEEIIAEEVAAEETTAENSKSTATDTEGDTPMKEGGKEGAEAPEPTSTEHKEEQELAKIEEARRKAAKREEEKKIRIKKGSWPEGDVWDALKEVGGLLTIAQERRKGGKGADGIGKGKVEKRTRYRAIGRESSWWDDIFLINSVHTHISITHVHMSAPYLRFLETGNLPNPDHELVKDKTTEWWEFKMKRSKWFDLMDPNDRLDAARLVTGVLAFLYRNEEGA